eukprot:4828439-Pyramimonas_sp.AAC.2
MARREERKNTLKGTFLEPFNYTDNGSVKYVVLSVLWLVVTWVLVTYGTLIRDLNGRDAEIQMLNSWGIALALEQFGRQGVQILV